MNLKRFLNFILFSVSCFALSACDQYPSSSISLNLGSPRLQSVALRNSSSVAFIINSFNITTPGQPVDIVPASNTSSYGTSTPCTPGLNLQQGQSCTILLQANKNYTGLFQSAGALHQVVTINTTQGSNQIAQQVDVTSQGYLYVTGNFTQLGDNPVAASASLYKCSFPSNVNQLSCSNVLPGLTLSGASATAINALALDTSGNVYFGGSFSTLSQNGSDLSLGSAYSLLVKYDPTTGTLSNAFNDSSENHNSPYYASSPAVIYALAFDPNNHLYITGAFDQVGGTALSGASQGANILAQCDLSKTSGQCTNALSSSTPWLLNWATSLSFYTSNASSQLLIAGPLNDADNVNSPFFNILPSCTFNSNGFSTGCTDLFASYSANIAFTAMASGNTIYTGGEFTSLGSVNANGPFLAQYDFTDPSPTFSNALGNAYFAGNGQFIQTLASDNNGGLFIAGQFNQITDGTTTYAQTTNAAHPYLLAHCTPGTTPTCTNLLSAYTYDGANDVIQNIVPTVEVTSLSIQVSH